MRKNRVVIVGGGFGGIYTALEFEKRRDPEFEVTLISQDNFFLFTPMLHEVAASDLDLTHIINPIRKLLRRVQFFEAKFNLLTLRNVRWSCPMDLTCTGILWNTTTSCLLWAQSRISTTFPIWPRRLLRRLEFLYADT
jgi:glycine/D-amino acid oxidase-like deaminating enzyme